MEQVEDNWDFVTYAGGLVVAFTILTLIRFYIKVWFIFKSMTFLQGAQFREKVNAKNKVVLVTGINFISN